jgi:uncharacterized protein (DUF433 family)
MAAVPLYIDTIVSDPTIRGGRPVIAGTGLTVADIMLAHTSGDKLSVEEIAAHYRLTAGQVHAALAYYYLHQEEIDARIRADDEAAEKGFAELEKMGRAQRIE